MPHPGVERVLFDVPHHLAQSAAITAPYAEEVFRLRICGSITHQDRIRSYFVGCSEFRPGPGLDNAAEAAAEGGTGPLAHFAARIAQTRLGVIDNVLIREARAD